MTERIWIALVSLTALWMALPALALESLDLFPKSNVEITTHEGPQRFHIWIGASAPPWRACARYSERRMIDTVSPAPASPVGMT